MDRKEARRIAEAVYPALPLLVFWMFLILAVESFPTLRSIVLLAAVLIPSLGGSWFLFRSKSRSAGMSEKETGEVKKASPGERQQKETEILALQNQINPHFLYNVLDSIRGQAIVEGVSEIAEMTEALSKLFRYSISNSDAVVYLGNEIKNLRTYFTIQQYRFNNRFELIIENDADDEAIMQYRIPKMTIQPIVENAIYHGLEMKLGRGSIIIRIDRTGRDLILHVIDDGVGMAPDRVGRLNDRLQSQDAVVPAQSIEEKSGIALLNVSRRLKMRFGDDYGLYIYSTRGVGTDVEIRLPLVRET